MLPLHHECVEHNPTYSGKTATVATPLQTPFACWDVHIGTSEQPCNSISHWVLGPVNLAYISLTVLANVSSSLSPILCLLLGDAIPLFRTWKV